ncbi:hypothetical protein SAMD00023353_6200290 [Rosellinia necatrix]|uniref:Uncharacterized protein n=1 Tax=Rosellinia necatrix TaxID=77044 RepID=A0A1S8AAA4_ROSNE|nr:hypothetical protein SAMD00023353_6200290 [Rosellinia necatrix]
MLIDQKSETGGVFVERIIVLKNRFTRHEDFAISTMHSPKSSLGVLRGKSRRVPTASPVFPRVTAASQSL